MSINPGYSEKDLRTIRSCVQDISLFHDPSVDKYRMMAATIMGVGYMDVTDNQRMATKEVMLKLVYGGFEEKSVYLQNSLRGTISGRMVVNKPPITYLDR